MIDAPLISKDRPDRDDEEGMSAAHGAGDQERLILQQDDYYADDLDGETAELEPLPVPVRGSETQAGWFIWLLTFAAGISGLLFGCESEICFQNGPRCCLEPIGMY